MIKYWFRLFDMIIETWTWIMTGPSLTSMKHLKHEHMYQRREHVFVLKDKRDQVGMP